MSGRSLINPVGGYGYGYSSPVGTLANYTGGNNPDSLSFIVGQLSTVLNTSINYTKLSKYVDSLHVLLDAYQRGHFQEVATLLTRPVYEIILTDLEKLKLSASKYPEYETIRQSYLSMITGLFQSVQQYADLTNLQAQYASCQEDCAILNDADLLRERLNQLLGQRQVFGQIRATQTVIAELKPQYRLYIEVFGHPQNFFFDPEKLSYILQMMQTQSYLETGFIPEPTTYL